MSMAYPQAKIPVTDVAPSNLYYTDGSRWQALSGWGDFFVTLGYETATPVEPCKRFVVALAVPTRSYAAALAAFGIVASRSALPVDQIAVSEHFQRLCQLETNTPVSLIKNGKRLKGIFKGRRNIHGETWLEIQVEDTSNTRSGGLTHLVPPMEAFNVEVLCNIIERLPKRQTGRLVQPLSPFARHFVSRDEANFTRQSRLECLIVGRRKLLRREIVETQFAASTDGSTFSEGSLQDVLRVRNFMVEGEAFRSDVFRVNSRVNPTQAQGHLPHVVIFDGATGFLRWRDHLRKTNWIVCLDRTDAKFRDATAVIDQDYIKYRVGDASVANLPASPTGVEVISYYGPLR